jgi:hypothetical protein
LGNCKAKQVTGHRGQVTAEAKSNTKTQISTTEGAEEKSEDAEKARGYRLEGQVTAEQKQHQISNY